MFVFFFMSEGLGIVPRFAKCPVGAVLNKGRTPKDTCNQSAQSCASARVSESKINDSYMSPIIF